MASETMQWIVVLLLALILLLVGVVCYYRKEDEDYKYDFLIEGSTPPENPFIRKFFKQTGGDVQNSVTNRRYLVSCEECRNMKLSPNACEQCTSYVLGQKFVKEGV